LILSDFTSVFLTGGSKPPELIVAERETSYFPKTVSVSEEFAKELLHDEGHPVIQTGYFYRNDERSQNFIHQVESLAQNGRLMIRPNPILLGLQRTLLPDGRRQWKAVGVEPNTPGETWFAEEKEAQNAIPLKEGEPDSGLEVKMCSFALPYLEGLSLEKLSEVLDAEGDYLSGFRNSVRAMLRDVHKEPTRAGDILNDVVRPATDVLERRFKSITNIHRIKVAGASVAVVTLGLTALTTAGIGGALAALLGAGGLGVISKEVADHMEKKAELKEMPYYLLWRLSKEARK
jgi:hypothetical protein